ncbi:UvrD-helicase domain-containing protein [uncultured Alistipes sp.]|uniref:UvrD-helicase domain-containing protein n=1 Tax=uncultured Alistipes sp. TaxID=538949 RepID=UPI00260564BC|nr:UvrD-helicase domain-containing protein [uncultured Alistipes sp.]
MRNIHYISAGAGSGKTHTLTEILADHIASGFCRPGEVLLTTFTEAAASEFREKTRRKLLEKGLVDAAFEMAGARIGTIHSVAKSLIDRYWYLLGLAPSMTVLDDEGRTRHVNESLAALATDDDLKVFRKLQRRFGFIRQCGLYSLPNPDFWKQHLEQILAWMDNYEVSLEESLDYCHRQFDAFFHVQDLPGGASLEAQLEQVKSYLQAISDSGDASKTTLDAITPPLALPVGEEAYVFVVKALSAVGKLPKKLQNKPFAPGYVQVCETLEKSLRHVSHGRLLKNYVERIFRLAADWRRDYADYKRRNRLIDFNDMERYSVQLLDREDVVRDIRESTWLVLVDEFQDCSPIEIRLFDRLSEIVDRSVWVGDTKQSIYGFRGSDAEMVETITRQFPEDVAQLNAAGCFRSSLPKSYRSRKKLVQAANAVFTPIFGPAAALEPHRGEEGLESLPPLELWQVEGVFCEAVADGVETLIQQGAAPGDIAILARWNDSVDALAGSLRNRGIPVATPETTIGDYLEVQLLVALINYAVLHDDFSKAAILALLADCPLDELLERRLNYLADPGDSRWLEEDALFRKIDRVIDRNRQQSISGFVESLIVELDFENRINRWSGPEAARRRAHLDSVLELAVAYETRAAQTGGVSLSGFARCLEQGQTTERPFEKDPRAVSVLSYHKSKGLEWKYVILTGLERDYRKRLFAQDLFEVQLHRTDGSDGGDARRLISLFPNLFGASNVPSCLEDPLRELLHYEATDRRVCREEARLLYVGFTRARDQLIAVQPLKSGKNGATAPQSLEWLIQVGAATKERIWHAWSEPVPVRKCVGATASRTAEEPPKAERYLRPEPPAQTPEPRYLQPSQLAVDPNRKPEVTLVADRGARIELRAGAETPMAEIGTTLHNILALCSPGSENVTERARQILGRHGMETVVPHPEQIGTMAEWLFGWLAREYGQACKVWHERPIRMWRDGQELNGSIDLVWETEHGCVVVDFKSFPGMQEAVTNPSGEHFAGRYAPQLTAYRRVLEAAGEQVRDTLVYYVVQGCLVRV